MWLRALLHCCFGTAPQAAALERWRARKRELDETGTGTDAAAGSGGGGSKGRERDRDGDREKEREKERERDSKGGSSRRDREREKERDSHGGRKSRWGRGWPGGVPRGRCTRPARGSGGGAVGLSLDLGWAGQNGSSCDADM